MQKISQINLFVQLYESMLDKCLPALYMWKRSSFAEYIIYHLLSSFSFHIVIVWKSTFKMQRSTGNKSVEYPEKCLLQSCFFPVASPHLSVDLIHKHVMLDSGRVWELMSWNRPRDLVFTIASGSHTENCVFSALLILSSMPVCESHMVMSGAYKQSFNQGIVWGEFF